MKILVPVKQVVDPNARIRLSSGAVETAGLKLVINPFDEIAIEEALRLRERGEATHVTVVTIGPATADDALRSALALGVDAAVRVDHPDKPEPLAVARLLAQFVARGAFDLVLLGRQAVDDDCGQTGPMLSALLDWPLATFASGIARDGDALTVTREVDAGLQVVRVPLPAVVTADLRLNTPRFASLPNIMKARRLPIAVEASGTLSDDSARRLEILGVTEPPARENVRMLDTVADLVASLRDRGLLQESAS